MRNTYIVVTEQKDGKNCSYVIAVDKSDNLKSKLSDRIIFANIMPTKKEAERVAKFWNDCDRKNGTFMFDF